MHRPCRPRVRMRAGGENGFNQAIELSSDLLANVKFVQVRAAGVRGAAGAGACQGEAAHCAAVLARVGRAHLAPRASTC